MVEQAEMYKSTAWMRKARVLLLPLALVFSTTTMAQLFNDGMGGLSAGMGMGGTSMITNTPTIRNTPGIPATQADSASLLQRKAATTEIKSEQKSRQPSSEEEIPNEFQDFVTRSIGIKLPMYGYTLFKDVPDTFAPVENIPVTPDYLIGPGDEIVIKAWGQVDIDFHAVVNRNGSIDIPKVGNINIAGIRYQQLQGYLKNAIGHVFRNFDLNVTLGRLRSIQVFVVGQAKRPGVYTVSSLSTLVNTLFASGGPSAKGSLRHIQIKRNGKLVTDFDLYDLLLKGDKTKDVALLPGDVIYIPPVSHLVAISGSINNSAIYEIKNERTSLAELIELAGGFTTMAAGQKVMVERIADRTMRKVEEFELDKVGLERPIRDGDLVQVRAIKEQFDNAVTLRGNVADPGRRPWKQGMRVKDLIPTMDALITPIYWEKQNQSFRNAATGKGDLQFMARPAAGENNSGNTQSERLKKDKAEINEDYDLMERLKKAVINEDYELVERLKKEQAEINMERQKKEQAEINGDKTLEDHLKKAEINWDYALIERLRKDDLSNTLIPFNLGKAIGDGNSAENHLLQPGDVVTIFSKNDIQVPLAKRSIYARLEGEINAAGVYKVLPGETLRQLVERVGGLTPNAYLFGAELNRNSVRDMQQKRLQAMADRMEADIKRHLAAKQQGAISSEDANNAKMQAEAQTGMVQKIRRAQVTGRVVLEIPTQNAGMKDIPDIALEDGDKFMVPSKPSTVSVMGMVYNENAFIHRPGKHLSDYLEQAGGPTRDADESHIYLLRADGSVISTKKSNSILSRFSTDYGGSYGEELMPGDTVVVPELLDRFAFTKELKDWSQILYQFALGVAGIKLLNL